MGILIFHSSSLPLDTRGGVRPPPPLGVGGPLEGIIMCHPPQKRGMGMRRGAAKEGGDNWAQPCEQILGTPLSITQSVPKNPPENLVFSHEKTRLSSSHVVLL